MRILIDTNVLLDVALKRMPFFANSAAVMDWAERNPRQAAIAWHSMSNISYLLKANARIFLGDLLTFMEVCSGDTPAVRQALALPTADVEDALKVVAAIQFRADFLVTRDTSDFKRLPIRAISPTEFARHHATP
jgi:predicted nucleic acid-binding protein